MVEVVESEESPPVRYRRLLMDIELARKEAGGTLPPAVEARWLDAIDRCWWCMTDAERSEFERSLGRTTAKLWRRTVVKLPPKPPEARGRLTMRQYLREEFLLPRWLVWGVLAVNVFLAVQAIAAAVKGMR